MARDSIAAACVLLLASSLSAPSAVADYFDALIDTRWDWRESVDPITDEVVRVGTILTTRVNISGEEYGHQARVRVVCVSGKSAIIVDWSSRVAAKKNLALEYRFAGQPGRRTNIRYINRTKQSTTDTADIRQFLADARVSNSLYVRVSSDTYGVSEATFTTRAGEDLFDHFVAVCPSAVPH